MFPFARPLASLCLVLFVVSASSGSGRQPNSQTSPTPRQSAAPAEQDSPPATVNVNVSIDVLSNRHTISSYVYGGAYPKDAATITDSGLSVVRWGGNSTSRYNWKLLTNNAANDWYYEDFNYSEIGDADSAKFIQDVKAAGSHPLMTMVMLPWVAKSAEGNGNGHWSFSVAKYGAQCSVDPYNTDAGDGLKTDCSTTLTANPNDANVPLLDQPGASDPPGSVYRNQWTAVLAAAFGTAPHFYNMDNEIEIWGGTHRDVHPNPTAYNEMRDTFLTEARALKGWDPKAIRLGPVTCCWWFYWNGANGNDKGAHAGVDFLPWWLNEVYWRDRVAGTRSVDIFDLHAYPDTPDTSSWTQAQKQALAVRIYRDYWDPTYVSESGSINQPWATFIQPNKTIPFRIPRLRAVANMIYPGTPISFTEWSAAVAGESDFSTALGDADAYGILGRERVHLASRWVAPDPANPNYLALKLFTNYDGLHHKFATISVADANTGDPNLFSSYAALNSTGKSMTILVLNKDPANTVQAQFALAGFTPQQVRSYTLASTNPTKIVASTTKSWSPAITFAPYTATLLVVTGTMQMPGAEWDMNPDTTMVAAAKKVILQPKIMTGTATVTLGTPLSDSGITLAVTQPILSPGQVGKITVTAGTTPGFYHYTVPSTDTTGIAQQQSGWILVGNPSASLTKTGDNQKAAAGTRLNLSVTLNPGQSGGSAAGGTVLFTASGGSLSSRIVTTDSSGKAAVVLTLPATAGAVHVTAEGQYALGHPVVTFTETAQ
ncbi:MAG TPA: glycoside hydrolase family 44 protein [Candidatus Sulfotelmatobacter sp.]|nr:glycoside hydrolase family 44 protein [Candidatus Sulfotelmatobacter sp.]